MLAKADDGDKTLFTPRAWEMLSMLGKLPRGERRWGYERSEELIPFTKVGAAPNHQIEFA